MNMYFENLKMQEIIACHMLHVMRDVEDKIK